MQPYREMKVSRRHLCLLVERKAVGALRIQVVELVVRRDGRLRQPRHMDLPIRAFPDGQVFHLAEQHSSAYKFSPLNPPRQTKPRRARTNLLALVPRDKKVPALVTPQLEEAHPQLDCLVRVPPVLRHDLEEVRQCAGDQARVRRAPATGVGLSGSRNSVCKHGGVHTVPDRGRGELADLAVIQVLVGRVCIVAA